MMVAKRGEDFVINQVATSRKYPRLIVASTPSSFSFIHVADLHLDTPFRGVHEVAPEIAAQLREASLDAFDAIVDLSLARNAAFVVIAGDVYDGAERGLRAQLRFRDGLARLSDAGIESFVVHGNHDPVTTGWSAIASWPDLAHVFPSGGVTVYEVERDGRRLATVQGISYATAATTENLALGFARPDGPGVHVGLLHCNVQGVAEGYDNYSPCSLEDLRRTRLDYLALGHIHQRRVLAGEDGSGPWIVYAGNSQARSPRRSEQEPKGATVVHVENGQVDHLEFVPCDQVRYLECEVSIEAIQDLGALGDALEASALSALESADGRGVVLRARVTGRGELHRDLIRSDSIPELLSALRDGAPTSPFCWWDQITDETASAIDLDEIRARGDFAADLLGVADEVASDIAIQDQLADALLSGAPVAIVESARSLLADPERRTRILGRARLLALDKVVGGDA